MQRITLALAVLAASAAVLPVHAQEFPARPVRIVVPFPAGSLTDTLSRLVAEGLHRKWSQPVLVENRGGASGNIGAEAGAKSTPDGHTLLFSPTSLFVTQKMLYSRLAYDPDAFVPVSVIAIAPVVLLANPKVPAQSVQELIAHAKANPDRLNYASSGVGGLPHLGAELFKSMAGIRIVHVPYQGTAPSLAALLAGQVDMLFDAVGAALPSIRAGKLRVLAVCGDKRYPGLPEVPAMNEVLPGFSSSVWVALAAPPKTPAAIAGRISAAAAEVVRQPDVTRRMLDLSFEAIGSSPEEMAHRVKQEIERWGKVVRLTGAKVE
ncbi:MAG: tripartite tricarboxylate transporter substrate binding protein [Burkholderiales bacterium]|nr:tripartite tricarboxylate transporter substrate binding protein [Burkholderiales bacterium]